ncbi:MAG TPA: extracellular solute-binding protein [Terriglobales bacterium]|nr:extracellular solute-binding protein [Terriglobales bacterium]
MLAPAAGTLTRRRFLAASAALALLRPPRLSAAEPPTEPPTEPIEVAYAGSMASVMEGALKPALARSLGLDLRGRAQGASALAEEIVGGTVRPDVFLAITAEPMRIVLGAAKAASALPFARTEMVVAFAPRSRFAPQFRRAGQPGAPAWYEILAQPGLRFGRTDPRTDPQGRNIIFVCQLAERYYHQPGLAARLLGPTLNPRQIFSEALVEGRLQSGQLDAASAYRTQPGPFHVPAVMLPPAINLGGDLPPAAAGLSLTLNGRTYRPQPLVFYAAALQAAPHPRAAQRFLAWLQGAQAQAILRGFGYDPPGGAAPLAA